MLPLESRAVTVKENALPAAALAGTEVKTREAAPEAETVILELTLNDPDEAVRV